MKVDLDDIAGMDFQAESASEAAGLFERAAEWTDNNRAAAVLRETAERLRAEAAVWEQAAELQQAVPVLKGLRSYMSRSGAQETASPALEEAIAATEARVKETLAPYWTPRREPT